MIPFMIWFKIQLQSFLEDLSHSVIRFTNVPYVDTGDEVSENKDSISLRYRDLGHFHCAMQFKD